ncbi:MAG: hypothetical protein AAFZ99_15400 [Pseudomonadota bacterium]
MTKLVAMLLRNSKFVVTYEKGRISFSITGFLLIVLFWALVATFVATNLVNP